MSDLRICRKVANEEPRKPGFWDWLFGPEKLIILNEPGGRLCDCTEHCKDQWFWYVGHIRKNVP